MPVVRDDGSDLLAAKFRGNKDAASPTVARQRGAELTRLSLSADVCACPSVSLLYLNAMSKVYDDMLRF